MKLNTQKASFGKTTTNAKSPIRVALVEDDLFLRGYLREILDNAENLRCVSVSQTAEEALLEIPRKNVDAAIVDLRLPTISGTELIRELKRLMPGLQILVYSSLATMEQFFPAIRAGASGYLVKSQPPGEIPAAIKELCEGGAPMSPTLARRLLATMQDPPGAPAPEPLTEREKEVLSLAARGKAQAVIAEDLGISYGTVRAHFNNIYKKLHVSNVTQALNKTGIS